MARRVSAKRYALALYQLAVENGGVEEWFDSLKSCSDILSDAALAGLMKAPKVNLNQKMAVISEVLPGLPKFVGNLLGILVTRGDTGIIPSVVEEYRVLLDLENGRGHAEITSVIPLDKSQLEKLGSYLDELTGKQVELNNVVDPGILAGVVARIGDKLIDGSAKTKLQDLKKSLTQLG